MMYGNLNNKKGLINYLTGKDNGINGISSSSYYGLSGLSERNFMTFGSYDIGNHLNSFKYNFNVCLNIENSKDKLIKKIQNILPQNKSEFYEFLFKHFDFDKEFKYINIIKLEVEIFLIKNLLIYLENHKEELKLFTHKFDNNITVDNQLLDFTLENLLCLYLNFMTGQNLFNQNSHLIFNYIKIMNSSINSNFNYKMNSEIFNESNFDSFHIVNLYRRYYDNFSLEAGIVDSEKNKSINTLIEKFFKLYNLLYNSVLNEKEIILVATSNLSKYEEIRNYLKELDDKFIFTSLNEIAIEPFEVPENGYSYEENSMFKAKYYGIKYGFTTICDDSGFEVEALDNYPGIFSNRVYKLKKFHMTLTDEELNKLNKIETPALYIINCNVKRALEENENADLTSRMVCSLALYRPHLLIKYKINNEVFTNSDFGFETDLFNSKMFRGEIEGVYQIEPKGLKGFGYDPYFYLPELDKTMGEISLEERDGTVVKSHRYKAFEKLRKYLLKNV